jgi:hypothetical protein
MSQNRSVRVFRGAGISAVALILVGGGDSGGSSGFGSPGDHAVSHGRASPDRDDRPRRT